MSRQVMAEIEQEVKSNQVVLYMKGTQDAPRCGFSASTANALKQHGVAFKDVDVLADPEKREAIKVYSEWPTLPQLYVRGEFIGGADIVRDLNQKGELEKILKQATEAA